MYRHRGVTVIETTSDVALISDKDGRLVFSSAEAIEAFFELETDIAENIFEYFELNGVTLTEAGIEGVLTNKRIHNVRL